MWHGRGSTLAALPAGQRAAVVLRHWLDLDVAECARLLRVDPGTVKSQTSRGPAKLRELHALVPMPGESPALQRAGAVATSS
jgi:DNA-directed RNA polymerase specialized sigma24 family protein